MFKTFVGTVLHLLTDASGAKDGRKVHNSLGGPVYLLLSLDSSSLFRAVCLLTTQRANKGSGGDTSEQLLSVCQGLSVVCKANGC